LRLCAIQIYYWYSHWHVQQEHLLLIRT